MGSGKSTVGRIVAQKLGWEFIDVDQQVERKFGKSIPEIFGEFGEAQFRKWETEYLVSIRKDPAIVATGGGCFIHNPDWMLEHGIVIYLDVPLQTLAKRLGADASRPLWQNAESLFHEREQHYRKAHYSIDGVDDPEAIASQIILLCNP